ncbi:hypothetical protein IE81DRAFT_342475 [Ceraceosorus guamensis]|uniref:Uncharacterized protein n=1 Tax=Ceraceosorus guamensis TaxID=1522189 RepID=A0A316VTI2_9BASI|nr:hypothetical protein IE81DRAFT_342475 [Ceraceosorus guamensis]PWN40802.1 hypothetical protein IE81DRAFT_342475 [Ceraceosorus guamensis]
MTAAVFSVFIEYGAGLPLGEAFRGLCCSRPAVLEAAPVRAPVVTDRVTIVPGTYPKLSKDLDEYADPYGYWNRMYGPPPGSKEMHPNQGEKPGIHHGGLTQGSSERKRLKAFWAHPGSVWRINRDFSITQITGPGAPKTMESDPHWHHFDAVHRGEVVGKFEIEPHPDGRPRYIKKGVYDIEDNPVHMMGPDARTSRGDAHEILKDMQTDHSFD